MLRVVLTVAMASTLLAISMPAVETARVQHSDERVATEVERVTSTAERLATRNDLPPPNTDGARRELTLRLPSDSFGTAGLDVMTVRTADRAEYSGVVRWRVDGGTEQVRHVTAVDLDVAGKLTLQGGGRHRLRLVHQPDGSVRIEPAALNERTQPDRP